jgi:hypothetical protein
MLCEYIYIYYKIIFFFIEHEDFLFLLFLKSLFVVSIEPSQIPRVAFHGVAALHCIAAFPQGPIVQCQGFSVSFCVKVWVRGCVGVSR